MKKLMWVAGVFFSASPVLAMASVKSVTCVLEQDDKPIRTVVATEVGMGQPNPAFVVDTMYIDRHLAARAIYETYQNKGEIEFVRIDNPTDGDILEHITGSASYADGDADLSVFVQTYKNYEVQCTVIGK